MMMFRFRFHPCRRRRRRRRPSKLVGRRTIRRRVCRQRRDMHGCGCHRMRCRPFPRRGNSQRERSRFMQFVMGPRCLRRRRIIFKPLLSNHFSCLLYPLLLLNFLFLGTRRQLGQRKEFRHLVLCCWQVFTASKQFLVETVDAASLRAGQTKGEGHQVL
jgi:hypothetical protein